MVNSLKSGSEVKEHLDEQLPNSCARVTVKEKLVLWWCFKQVDKATEKEVEGMQRGRNEEVDLGTLEQSVAGWTEGLEWRERNS